MPVGAISAAKAGAALNVTGAVETVLGRNAFVLHGEDVRDRQRLVLGSSVGLYLGAVVTVTGRVRVFDFASFASEFGLKGAALYEPFAGRKVLVAQRVDAWA